MKYKIYTVTDGTTVAVTEAEEAEVDGFLAEVCLEELSRRGSDYAKTLRGYARGLWNGSLDFFQAWVGYNDNIRIGLTQAWNMAARECGIEPADMTAEELDTLQQIIASERAQIRPFLLWVAKNDKKSGVLFRALGSRIEMWGLRWDDVFSRSKLVVCSNQKTRWTIDYIRTVKKNCKSCKNKLNGKVKRNSFWHRAGVQPQNPPNSKLVCGGFL